jgi:hypothetical protein
MRVSEDRYTRDLRRINLAHRMIRLDVRTLWICAWTGLKPKRIRNLVRSYSATLRASRRMRGAPPRNALSLVRSSLAQNEASALAGIAARMQILPDAPTRNAKRMLAELAIGERMCRGFELYREIVPEATFTMEHFILLVTSLAERQILSMEYCESCFGALVVDCPGAQRRRCPECRKAPADTSESDVTELADCVSRTEARQQALF